ncbi:DUF968 domain-containing protein [Edwardsiella anguillarum]|nr:DUF968 domain-containing protein [Edwardsiella anguillarum]KAB0585077.1 DUF968 domain-containing protein [Edwardsiella anguillarum]UOU79948.1 DUF968 domain-containing protein [Edwardsiella anguillarum]
MRMLFTAYPQRSAGVVLLKTGKLTRRFIDGQRVMLADVPAAFHDSPAGELVSDQLIAADPVWRQFFAHERVQKAAGLYMNFSEYLESFHYCQWKGVRDGYHDIQLTTTHSEHGGARLCWTCDNAMRGTEGKLFTELCEKNRAEWVIEAARRGLTLPEGHQLTGPELCWWALVFGVADLIPGGIARRITGVEPEEITGVMSESTIIPNRPTAQGVLAAKVEVAEAAIPQEKMKPVIKLAADEAPAAGFMLRPKLQRWESEKYTRWVKTQACCGCGSPADDPHHIINSGLGLGGVGTKAHDLFVIPLCRRCHDELHRDVSAWERQHGSQVKLLVQFLNRALGIGAILKA